MNVSATDSSLARASDRLLELLGGYERLVVATHDNPDPDGISTGWAVVSLVRACLGIPGRLVSGGTISRAENRQMVSRLGPPIELIDRLEVDAATAVVLVDCGADATNHLLRAGMIEPVGVIDHHEPAEAERSLPFRDLRTEVVANASIATAYLREQEIEPAPALATALLLGVWSEIRGNETRFAHADRAAIDWLTDRADHDLMAEIQNAPLPVEYFSDVVLAVQNTFVYGRTAICLLPQASAADTVGEAADLLVRCEHVDRILCAALVGEDMLLSARTTSGGGHAAQLVARTVRDLGRSGGHEHRAGGRIFGVVPGDEGLEPLHRRIRQRWLAACGVEGTACERLVSKRTILENL